MSLSQTCRTLRPVFLRYLYQRIEVYEEMMTSAGLLPSFSQARKSKHAANFVYKKYAEELVRQLEIVTIRDPSLAQHVNILNVLVVNHSIISVLEELARCIALFPKLHTVQLVFRFPFTGGSVLAIFKGHQYPQIRNVCVSGESTEFLVACPNAECITPYRNKPYTYLPRAVESCRHLRTLGSVYFDADTMKRETLPIY
ncbi:hypothetical protein CPB84DRAFT_268957 [Gymnopilus junonius]|uniref:Uncharacterized protein n=1 Tax=Gymnopilus junonius TaxID=109634 RepID=A0A9P5NSJ0_GYMJU|nr:hypothetical protein CPB84DRAFT_268957 [Gymnopilus junonius]